MALTLAFDVYGTLIDTAGIAVRLQGCVGERATAFAQLWREKQLEYSFRRGLMQNYQDFSVCTRQALEYACRVFAADLSEADREGLLAEYRRLPVFPDVADCLTRLGGSGCRLYAFSNGPARDVQALLHHAGIEEWFADIVSVDEVRSFKPNPAVYCHFLRRARVTAAQAWLISGNPFDVIGAVSAGMCGAWVRRSPQTVFDPWELQPTVTVSSLRELPDVLLAY